VTAEAGISSPVAGTSPARVVFFGSGSFAVPVLDTLLASAGIRLVGVVSAPDRPTGRRGALTPTPVVARARAAGLTVLQPARIRAAEAIADLVALAPDLGVLADYGQIIPPALLDLPAHGILNVHPSLLPRHRGATPVPATIIAGDAEAGVTIIRMDAGLDTGPVLAADGWPLHGDETAPDLEAEAALRGARLLASIIPAWLAGEIRPMPQDDATATLTRPFRRVDGLLDPRRSAVELERRVRALAPWPGTFLETVGGRLVVHRAAVGEGSRDDRIGELVADGDGLALATAEGRLRLLEVQPAGGKRMSAAALRRGVGRGLAGTFSAA
jgi:methionyl-tRNA formyltransferase